jgi:hypothetical protein
MTEQTTRYRLLTSVRTAVREYVDTNPQYAAGGTFHVIGVLSVKQDASGNWNVVNDNHVSVVAQDGFPDPEARKIPGLPQHAVVVEYLLRTTGNPVTDLVELVWEPDSDALVSALQRLAMRQDGLQRMQLFETEEQDINRRSLGQARRQREEAQRAADRAAWAQAMLEAEAQRNKAKAEAKALKRTKALAKAKAKKEAKKEAKKAKKVRKQTAVRPPVTDVSVAQAKRARQHYEAEHGLGSFERIHIEEQLRLERAAWCLPEVPLAPSNCKVMRNCCGSIPHGMSRYQVPKYNLEFYEGRSYRETPSYCWRQGRTAR